MFSFSTESTPVVGTAQSRIRFVPWAPSPGLKRLGHKSDRSLWSSAPVKISWKPYLLCLNKRSDNLAFRLYHMGHGLLFLLIFTSGWIRDFSNWTLSQRWHNFTPPPLPLHHSQQTLFLFLALTDQADNLCLCEKWLDWGLLERETSDAYKTLPCERGSGGVNWSKLYTVRSNGDIYGESW